jgi:hypothetical protein
MIGSREGLNCELSLGGGRHRNEDAAEGNLEKPPYDVIPAKVGIQVAVTQSQNGFPLSRE